MERQARARIAIRSRGPSVHRSIIPSEALRLIDQHDGNVVLDGVDQPAGVTSERFRIEAMLERSFALGADENLEEVGREAHEAAYPSRLRRSEEHTSELQSPVH